MLRWEAFGVSVAENEKFEIRNRGQELVISDVLVEDAKQYTCSAGNVVGRANKLINLVVHGICLCVKNFLLFYRVDKLYVSF